MDTEFDAYTTFTIGVLFLLVGKMLNKRVRLLREFNIPEPVTGGLLAALIGLAAYLTAGIEFTFDLDARDGLILYFFTGIGLNASLSKLRAGGVRLIILTVICVGYIFVQNYLSVSLADATGLKPVSGLLCGSVSLVGGHGTTIAWAPTFINQYGIANAMEMGIACATAGLVLSSIMGGPIARGLIRVFRLTPNTDRHIDFGVMYGDKQEKKIDYFDVLGCWFIMNLCIALGSGLDEILESFGIMLPTFVSCLALAIVATNTVPPLLRRWNMNVRWPNDSDSLGLISDISLGSFLVMSLMSLHLWALVDLAGPILIILAAQFVLAVIITTVVVFPLMGRDYEAAVVAAGFGGISLGATPIAIANMQAVTERYGAAHKAFIIVPLVSAFIIDIANAGTIKLFLHWFG
ncbi:sodium/glutamate symporter [Ruficoccus amylovorans]|uniref:Sodium/glutamate symporter n=1 Tax=Ruficoccus amylovorans TaxID=1804625 RepID=A0A842HD05_9BACT|nr:sodium/glutamate symporter [Ruficoccus amylovorans]MBC2594302.1 sodium/glutamate symporter [Ruficoccus amylovorans]